MSELIVTTAARLFLYEKQSEEAGGYCWGSQLIMCPKFYQPFFFTTRVIMTPM